MQCMKREALSKNVIFVEGQVEKVHCVDKRRTPGIGEPLLSAESIQFRRGKAGSNNNDREEIVLTVARRYSIDS